MFPELLYQHLVQIGHKLAGAILARRKPQWSFSWVKLLTVMAVVLLSTLLSCAYVSPTPSMSPSQPAKVVPWTPHERQNCPFLPKKLRDHGFVIATL
jgi:hypothetical protein